MSGWRLLVFTLAPVVIVGVMAHGSRDARACSPADFTLEEQADLADTVVVGEVVEVRAPERGRPQYTIRVATSLKDEAGRWLVVTPHSQCGDAVRLERDGQFLLFLSPEPNPDFARVSDTLMFDGRYVLEDGEFHRGYEGPLAPEDVLQQVAAVTGAPPDAVQAGVDFAQGRTVFEQPADDNAALPWVGFGAAVGAAALLAGFVVARRALLGR